MIEVARSRNAFSIARKQVVLEVADVSLLPFADHTFDKAVAINTVYFWTSLAAGLREIRRVLRSNGVLAIAAITPEAAIEMPFAAYGFAVYDALALELACMAAGFNQVCIEPFVEPLTNPQAEAAPREFFLVSASASNG
jgi:arsenite methyltransferase